MKAWLANQSTQIKYGIYGLSALTGILFYSWVWSLLFSLFYSSNGLATPWLAPALLLNQPYNTLKINTLLWLTLLTPIVLICTAIYSNYRHKQLIALYGDAHWASLLEIKKMGLLNTNQNSLIIGDKGGRLLRALLVSHALIFAPSRSGKGTSQVMPNVLAFNGSMLIVDFKHEIFQDTSGFRSQHGQQVFLFSPAHPKGKTHCFNPLDLVNRHPSRIVADIQLVTEILIAEAKGNNDSMWMLEARALAQGLLLWLLNSGRPFTLGELAALVKGTPDFVGFLRKIVEDAVTDDGNIKIHPIAYQNINNFIQKAAKEQSGVKSSLSARLNLWDDPFINAATSKSDFTICDMRRTKITVYLGIPINQKDRLAPLMNLFVQLFLNIMTEELPQKDEPHKVLVVLDEFCSLGYMKKVKDGFSYLAGYNIHLMAIIQNIGQFYELYGRDGSDVFFQNTDYKIAYRQNTRTDQEFISNQLGTKTVKTRSISSQKSVLGRQQPSQSDSYIARPLLTIDEVRQFPTQQGIAIINGQAPVRYKRIIHYKDKRFKRRILPPVEIMPIAAFHPALQITKPVPPVQPQLKQDQAEMTKSLTNLITIAHQLAPTKKYTKEISKKQELEVEVEVDIEEDFEID